MFCHALLCYIEHTGTSYPTELQTEVTKVQMISVKI